MRQPKIYQLPVSLYSFKVRLAMSIAGASIPLAEPPGGSYRSAAYRDLVPPGTVPALVVDGFVLTEADAIIEYIDETGGGAQLVAGSPERKARIRMLSRLIDLRLEARVRALFGHVGPVRRDSRHVGETGLRIGDELALLEWAIDAEGPFSIDHRITMPDCGIAATLTWLQALAPALSIPVAPGPRLARVYAALNADALAGPELAGYRPLVDAWVGDELRS